MDPSEIFKQKLKQEQIQQKCTPSNWSSPFSYMLEKKETSLADICHQHHQCCNFLKIFVGIFCCVLVYFFLFINLACVKEITNERYGFPEERIYHLLHAHTFWIVQNMATRWHSSLIYKVSIMHSFSFTVLVKDISHVLLLCIT